MSCYATLKKAQLTKDMYSDCLGLPQKFVIEFANNVSEKVHETIAIYAGIRSRESLKL